MVLVVIAAAAAAAVFVVVVVVVAGCDGGDSDGRGGWRLRGWRRWYACRCCWCLAHVG